MSFSVEYKLSKDTYPELTICPEATILDHGINGITLYHPRDIDVVILPEESGQAEPLTLSIDELVSSYLELKSVIEGP